MKKRRETEEVNESSSYSSKSILILIGLIFVGLIGLGIGLYHLTANNEEFSTVSGKNESAIFEILDYFPHDPQAFTQGLLYKDGYLFESTGSVPSYNDSSLRKVNITTGEVVQQIRTVDAVNNRARYFSEGLCLINGILYQLTWKAGKILAYNLDSFSLLSETDYVTDTTTGEGWGIAYTDDTRYFDKPILAVSDGSDVIHIWDPDTQRELRTIRVKDRENGETINNLNELEFVKGELLANIWYNDKIIRIDPYTGDVIGYYDFSFDNLPFEAHGNVLNGIAYDKERDETYITGKFWRYLLKVKLYT